ncbi:MAG: hypothetical protein ACI8Y4_003146 [Candidatus Poriferisodalaceae bacterium]
MTSEPYEPQSHYSRDEIVDIDTAVRSRPLRELSEVEEIFRIETLGMEWDIAVKSFTPSDPTQGAFSPDGRRNGFLLLHGGASDLSSMEPLARELAGRHGHTALAMTFPGRHYFRDPSRLWPGDTIATDGTVRTPIWLEGEEITPDQYDVVEDTSMKLRYGTRTLARAKPGTVFYDRMAAWPMAFENAMIEACKRYFPDPDWWVYTNGHSTGGAFSALITQRVPNIAGQAEIETAPIGYINQKKHGARHVPGQTPDPGQANLANRTDAFHDLSIRTWRDLARYAGYEAMRSEGEQALERLAWMIEDVLDDWDQAKSQPNFKAEFPITHNVLDSLESAARAAAQRLSLDDDATADLVERYRAYCRYDERPEAKPVPPILYVNTKHSRDNTPDAFNGVILPMLGELDPPPRVHLVTLDAGTHVYYTPADDLPEGMVPLVAEIFSIAIEGRFYESV